VDLIKDRFAHSLDHAWLVLKERPKADLAQCGTHPKTGGHVTVTEDDERFMVSSKGAPSGGAGHEQSHLTAGFLRQMDSANSSCIPPPYGEGESMVKIKQWFTYLNLCLRVLGSDKYFHFYELDPVPGS
jgi:hypothetical protein